MPRNIASAKSLYTFKGQLWESSWKINALCVTKISENISDLGNPSAPNDEAWYMNAWGNCHTSLYYPCTLPQPSACGHCWAQDACALCSTAHYGYGLVSHHDIPLEVKSVWVILLNGPHIDCNEEFPFVSHLKGTMEKQV